LIEHNYKYFKIEDFNCSETNENQMEPSFIKKLDKLREVCGFPFYITSGFRSKNHSAEKSKQNPGSHCRGIAADIAVTGGQQRMQIVRHAAALNFTGIGVAKGFVHVDTRDTNSVLWSY
jgi:uncharacterized protein YcbK (DUF882 family)|tara:strand:- start:157 stop:513 length:357 start_codon:yes stop_codon:yes gene_type:complete